MIKVIRSNNVIKYNCQCRIMHTNHKKIAIAGQARLQHCGDKRQHCPHIVGSGSFAAQERRLASNSVSVGVLYILILTIYIYIYIYGNIFFIYSYIFFTSRYEKYRSMKNETYLLVFHSSLFTPFQQISR